MNIRILRESNSFPILWIGISRKTIWLDINNIFSIDVSKWFLRIYLKLKGFAFCRYLGRYE